MEPSNRKLWAGNLLIRFDFGSPLQCQMRIAKLKSACNLFIIDSRGLQCETNFKEFMGWESSDVVRFDLGSLHHGLDLTFNL